MNWWLARVTLVVAFGFLSQKFGELTHASITLNNDLINGREQEAPLWNFHNI